MSDDAPVQLLPLGAIIQSFKVNGVDIVQGFPTQEQYARHNTPYFGETIGRVANRIRGARIDDLDGRPRALAANNGPNCLHGGVVGWGKRVWDGPVPVGVRRVPGVEGVEGGETVVFSLRSDDGDEGFPGDVEATVTYTAGTQVVEGKTATVLGIEYEARLVGGAEETVVNMTNHSYFNLSGTGGEGAATIDGTVVTLGARDHLPVDATSIPTGAPVPYPSVDTTAPFALGATEPRFDYCFALPGTDPAAVPIDTRARPLALNLAAHHPGTGIHLEVLSTEPSFQFYTGDFTDVPAVDGAPARGPRSAFCCEPGRFVNAVNVPEWRGMTVLKKGETYGARIVYRAWVE
ncbi:Aldose 1-epimerase [Purpureocillium takamizusanense]|uniref:Aldose 1-epimerase n=1 Tax=Purpureocillium takamizusanense TaxID=2060973 RepID=A0A9Q8V8U3_9HYPO|nr:Aldose 1-epimerase [Purpureocillium takamizusanense]UNI17510.1 Aldose 1-epimerase [Purpureocillium takamizusanense]